MKRFLITIILLVTSHTLFSQQRCDYCRGAGYVVEKVYKTCTNCGGQGERRYTEIKTKPCSYCNGTKRVETKDKDGRIKKDYCTHCENGEVKTTTTFVEICPKCEGDCGYYVDEEKRCPKYGGSGKKQYDNQQ